MKYLYLLRPTSAVFVHGGMRKGLLPRSDTLSAAIVSVWLHANPSADIAALASMPPFRITSALPWVTRSDGARELLLPVPCQAMSAAQNVQDGCENWKRMKKLAFVDANLLARVLNGDYSTEGCTIWDKDFLLTSFKGSGVFAHKLTRTRLSIDRLSGGPREGFLFESGEWLFASACGWGLVAEMDPGALPDFTAALQLLGMEGLGSDRSSGVGQFELLEGPIPWSEPTMGCGAHLLLSLCRPSTDEVNAGILDGRYTLIERSGWITAAGARSLRRGRVRMMTEGSWYPDGPTASPGTAVQVQGADVNLGLFHPIFRDGRAITISIQGEVVHA